MKTILIAHNYSKKSFSNMSYELAHHLAGQGNHIIFISHQPFFKDVFEINVGSTGKIIVYSWLSEASPRGLKNAIHYLKIILKYRPKVVIAHFTATNICATVSKVVSFGRVRTIIYYHTLYEQIRLDSVARSRLKVQFLYWRKRIFYHIFCDVIVCPSEKAKKDLRKYFRIKDKAKVILNPMEDRHDSSYNKSKDLLEVSFLGRLSPSKGILLLATCFSKYCQLNSNTKIRLKIAGNGLQKEKIVELSEKNTFINYVGPLSYSEIDIYLKRSGFTVIPSLVDNLPTVGLESLMNGTPLLISKNTGLFRYLTENHDSISFSPTIEGINSLFYILEEQSKNLKTLAHNARLTYKKKFSMASYFENIDGLLI